VFQETVAEVVVILVTCTLDILRGMVPETLVEPVDAKTITPGMIMHNANKIKPPSSAHFCFLNISPFFKHRLVLY
jgi:hypothetical protein